MNAGVFYMLQTHSNVGDSWISGSREYKSFAAAERAARSVANAVGCRVSVLHCDAYSNFVADSVEPAKRKVKK